MPHVHTIKICFKSNSFNAGRGPPVVFFLVPHTFWFCSLYSRSDPPQGTAKMREREGKGTQDAMMDESAVFAPRSPLLKVRLQPALYETKISPYTLVYTKCAREFDGSHQSET